MTQAQNKQYRKLEICIEQLRDIIYKVYATRNDVPFQDCYKAASIDIRQMYDDAINALMIFENQMIAEGRGYRQNGRFYRNWS